MEILVVIGLVAIIGTLALFMDFNNYRSDAFRSEINTLGTALQTARALARVTSPLRLRTGRPYGVRVPGV